MILVQVSTLVNSNSLTNKQTQRQKAHKCWNVDLASQDLHCNVMGYYKNVASECGVLTVHAFRHQPPFTETLCTSEDR